jgi:hypothetical protein
MAWPLQPMCVKFWNNCSQPRVLGGGGPNCWTPWHLRVKKVLKMSTIEHGCIPKTHTYNKNLGYVLFYTTNYDNQLFKCLLNLDKCIKSVLSNGGLFWHGCLGNITIFVLFMNIKYKIIFHWNIYIPMQLLEYLIFCKCRCYKNIFV